MNDTNPPFQATPPQRFPWGCLFGGCFLVFAFILIGTGTVGYLGYRYYTAQVDKYTSAKKADIPVVASTKEEVDAIQKRFDDFKTAMDSDKATEPLVLTADDINTLINANKDLKGKVYVTIADGELTAQVSVPTDMMPGAKGRYFNGRISLKASLENGVLIVTLDEAEVNGEPVPEKFMNTMRNENLAKDMYKDPKNAELLRKFERLVIEDDKIVLIPAPVKETTSTESTVAPEVSKFPDPETNAADQQQN